MSQIARPLPQSASPPLAGGVKVGPRTGAKREQIILLANQLSVMLDTGVPLGAALRGIADRTTDPKFGAMLQAVVGEVEAGEQLSQALSRYKRAFPPIMIALVRASEASGTMEAMLDRVGAYLSKEHQIIKQVRGALVYPAFMFFMCLSITTFLLAFVLPRFATMYAGKAASLPGATRFLMALSDGLVQYWYVWIAAAVALVAGVLAWRRTSWGRVQIDWLKLDAPLASSLFGKLYLSRACRTLGTLLETGVPLLDTVPIVKDVTPNAAYDRLWKQVEQNLHGGQPLSAALLGSPVIPEHIAQMVESGEGSGRLGKVFSRVADFAEADFDQAVKTTTQFIEPVMIVVMGAVIGFIAIALLMPIFSMGSVASGG